jgi:cytochrome c556
MLRIDAWVCYMNKLLLSIALLAIGRIHGAHADGPMPDELIAARKASMEAQSSLLAAIMQAIVVNADIRPFAATGEAIATWSRDLLDLFPTGTEAGNDTQARPAVWSDRAGFEKAAANLTEAAQTMAKAAAAGDQAEFIKAYRGTMLACAACHVTYRFGRN